MIRLVFALLLAWALAAPAQAQLTNFPPGAFAGKAARDPAAGGGGCSISVLQNVPADATNTVVTATLSPTTAGSVIVVMANWVGGTGTWAFTDSAGDTPTDYGNGLNSDGNASLGSIEAFLSPTTGVTSVTITLGASVATHMQVYEVAGLTSKVFDAHPAGVINTTTTSLIAGPTGTLSSSCEFGLVYFTAYGALSAVGGGFTPDVTNNTTVFNLSIGHDVVSSNASLTPTATVASAILGAGFMATVK